jgi:hypothetical protein
MANVFSWRWELLRWDGAAGSINGSTMWVTLFLFYNEGFQPLAIAWPRHYTFDSAAFFLASPWLLYLMRPKSNNSEDVEPIQSSFR